MFIVSIGTEPVIMPSVAGFYIADFVNGVYYIDGTLSSEIDVITNPSKIIGGKGLVVDSTEDIIFQPGFLFPITDLAFTIIIEYETKGMLATDAAEILHLFNSANVSQLVSLYHGYGAESVAQHLTLFSTYTSRPDQFIELTMPRSGRHIAAYSKSPNQANLSLSLDGKSNLQSTSVVAGPFVLDSGKSIVYQANVELVIRHIRILPFVFKLDDLQTVASFNSPRPSNDNFASAASLTDGDSLAGSTVAATSEVGEPNHASIVGGCSAWWRIDAVADGTYTITLSGDDVTNYMDPLLAVYTGTAVNSLGLVASTNGTSVSFTGAAGTTYYVAVDDHNGPTCGADFTIGLAVSTGSGPPPNDNFANAIALTSGDTRIGTNLNATTEGSEQFHSGYAPPSIGGATIWYKYTPSADETININLYGSATDTVLTVWTGGAIGSLTEVAFNDDSTEFSTLESAVSFAGTAGVTYYIQVDNYDGPASAGFIRINVNRVGIYPPPPDTLDDDVIYQPRTNNLYPSIIVADDLTFSPYIFNPTIFDAATIVGGVSLSGGNLVATNTGTTGAQSVLSNKDMETQIAGGVNSYFEVQFTTITGGNNMQLGFNETGHAIGTGAQLFLLKSGAISNGFSTLANLGTINAGDWIAVATVFEGGADVYFRNVTQNGTWNGIGGATIPTEFNSVTEASFVFLRPFVAFGGTGGISGNVFTANFGATPFVGTIPPPRHRTSQPDNKPYQPGWF